MTANAHAAHCSLTIPAKLSMVSAHVEWELAERHSSGWFPAQGYGADAARGALGKANNSETLEVLQNMRRKLMWLALAVAAMTLVAFYHAKSAWASQVSGFTGTTLVKGTFAEFEVFNQLTQGQLQQFAPGFPGPTWFSLEKTKGPSDLYIQSNTWAVGGSTGWHRHPGHSLIIITAGQVTQYHPDCTPEVYGPGTANGPTLLDSGDDEHLIRNEGSVPAAGFAVQIVPAGATRRIDEPEPDTCQIP